MRVGIITSWDEKCGIAEYSRNLAESLRKLRAEVRIYPLSEIRNTRITADSSQCDIVNFQYEHGLLKQAELRKWASNFRVFAKNLKLFVTLHQVLEEDSWNSLYNTVDGVIVHSQHFGPVLGDKTHSIPHGCPIFAEASKTDARRKIGQKHNEPILSTFGFMLPHKGWEMLIGAMPIIQQKYPRSKLFMVCSHFKDKNKTEPTADAMKKYAKSIGANVKFFHDKWSIHEFMPLIQASDIFLTSQEKDDRMIVSGSAMMGISARRPTITNDCSIYSLIHPYSYVVPRGSVNIIAEAVLSLLSDENLYAKYYGKAFEAYELFNWDAVAKQHLRLYKGD